MSDVNAHIIEPLKKFAKESMHLVKKCTKPDRKGEGRTACVSIHHPHHHHPHHLYCGGDSEILL